jgi:signal transduction histidine kinase
MPLFLLSRQRVLLAGFGGLLLLMAVAAADALFSFREIRIESARLHQSFLFRHHALDDIRFGIFLSGIFVRDYLLAPTPAIAEEQWVMLQDVRAKTDAAVKSYSSSISAAELAPFRSLTGEINTYWKVLDLMFHLGSDQKKRASYPYFYKDLVQRRVTMLDLADRIANVNDRELASGDEKSAEIFDRFWRRLIAVLGVTLGGAAIVAAVTVARLARLENEARLRYQESKDLSARLVKAQEDERRAISRELHDEAGQSLSALLMEAGNAAGVDDPAQLRSHIESIRALAQNSVDVVRNMALLLRPSMLDDFGLAPALEWHAREVSKRTGLKIQVEADLDGEDLPDDLRTCVYRVVQEALNNCARHAQARNARITLDRQADCLIVRIEDDGRGFPAGRFRGLGLLGIEERVGRLNGSFRVDTEPGKGARLQVEFPLNGKRPA